MRIGHTVLCCSRSSVVVHSDRLCFLAGGRSDAACAQKVSGNLPANPRAPTSTGKDLMTRQIGKEEAERRRIRLARLLVAEAKASSMRAQPWIPKRSSSEVAVAGACSATGLRRGRPMASRGHIICIGISSMLMQFPGFPGHRCDVFRNWQLHAFRCWSRLEDAELGGGVLLERMRS